jgi:hypothetical protein
MRYKENKKMTVHEIISTLPNDITWTLIKEDYSSDHIGTTIGTVQYDSFCPIWADSEINKAMNSIAVSIDLIENVIFYTEEEINK